jgi:hypothetical protein
MNKINGEELSPEDLRAHQVAIEGNRADAYLLGELDDDEREAFEEHFFNCAGCAASIQSGLEALDDLREHVPEPVPVPAPAGNVLRFEPTPKAGIRHSGTSLKWAAASIAASVVVVFAGYQSLVTVPRLIAQREAAKKQTAAVTGLFSGIFLTGEMRGNGETPHVPAGKPFSIILEIGNDSSYVSFHVEIRDAEKKLYDQRSVPAAETVDMLTWVLPPLPAGTYTAVIEGVRKDGNRTRIATDRFDVRPH